jgi:hypothetical protein
MSRRSIWTVVFLALTGGAIGMELVAGLDNSPDTVPWTELITRYIPAPITYTAIAILAAWLPAHFAGHYLKGGSTMANIKLYPVAWLTTAAVVVGAVLEADAQYHILPGSWAHWLAFAALALGLIVAGMKAHGAVTPLADPKDNGGVSLVPVTTIATAAPDLPGVPRAAWEPKHVAERPKL